jgi:hypothetical protein
VQSVGTAVVLESSCGFHDVIVCLYECMRGYFSKKKTYLVYCKLTTLASYEINQVYIFPAASHLSAPPQNLASSSPLSSTQIGSPFFDWSC